MKVVALLLLIVALVAAEVYMAEKFEDGWEKKWVEATEWRAAHEMGHFKWTAGEEFFADAEDKGIKTGPDAKFFSISAPMDKVMNNQGKDMVVQFTVKHEQDIDCGGAYIKVLPTGLDQASFGGDSEYALMFGPDICGSGTRRTHVIFNYKGENHLINKEVRCETDRLSHMYTLIVRTDNTYEVRIDGNKVESGDMPEDWDFLPPAEIRDPEASKPEDWEEEEFIADPEDVKPAGWDDVSPQIPDPDAELPEDWDEEEDGEWEPPMIENPEYQGEWSPSMIKNPEYKGPWIHPMIPNPEYVEDNEIYNVCKSCGFVGFELWQVRAGSVFDDIFVGDSIEEAEAFANETFFAKKEAEEAAFEKLQEAIRAEEAEREAEREAALKEMEEEEEQEEVEELTEEEFEEVEFEEDKDEVVEEEEQFEAIIEDDMVDEDEDEFEHLEGHDEL
eukprot:TRINITY_DN187_c0_g2_i1.p1 TRINITY_DN187_c0_g2~~TRINITY_DN187_c0_g2_i1.p1  ORF type:complete len:446 (+),score=206.54 TRINITY_DN187_c0_g2_i1:35-1372(+)